MKFALAATAFAAAIVSSGATAVAPSYTESYTFSTGFTVSDIVTANEYIADEDGPAGRGGFTSGYPTVAPGVATLTDGFLKKDNLLGTYFMGTSSLDTDSPNHLVIAVNDGFATTAAGVSFEEVFGGDISEVDLVGALETIYNPGSDVDALNAAGGVIFDFTSEFFDDGAYFSPKGGSFTLLSFSDGMVIGAGTASLTDTSAPAVPEPASWALMIGGFGLVGGALRSRAHAPRLTA